MVIIHQKDKRSGITYAYESISFWDKEKHQSRAHRKLIGRVSASGEIIPTDGRCSRNPELLKKTRKRGPVPMNCIQRSFYGATWLLDQIGEKLGLINDLRICFPEDYRKLLSIVYLNFSYHEGNYAFCDIMAFWAIATASPGSIPCCFSRPGTIIS